MTPITRPCPHCGHDYDITRRLNGDQVRCPCGGWFLVVMYPDGRTKLVKSLALEPARETAADATLVAEMTRRMSDLERERDQLRAACEGLITAMIQLDKEHHREVAFAQDVMGQAAHPAPEPPSAG